MFRDASLPDRCIICAAPSNGNIYQATFEPHHFPTWHVPVVYDIAYLILGTRYIVDFPFCSICTPKDFDIETTRINKTAGFFRNVSNTFLKLLPTMPVELARELDGSRWQRIVRNLME